MFGPLCRGNAPILIRNSIAFRPEGGCGFAGYFAIRQPEDRGQPGRPAGEIRLIPVLLQSGRRRPPVIGYSTLIKSYSSLLRYWRCDETSGTTLADSSGHSGTATKQAGTLTSASGALVGDTDAALTFDASTYYNAAALGSLSKWTLEGWVKRNGSQAGTGTAIPCVIADAFGGHVNFMIGFDEGAVFGSAGFIAGFFDGAWHTTPAATLTNLTWAYVAATYNGSTLQLYVNGSPSQSLSYAGTPTSDGVEVRIGRRWDLADEIKGDLDELAIYNDALTAAQVLANYRKGSGT